MLIKEIDFLVDTAPRIYPGNVTWLIRIGGSGRTRIITATNWSSVNKHTLFICSRSKLLILGDGHLPLTVVNPYYGFKDGQKFLEFQKSQPSSWQVLNPEPVATLCSSFSREHGHLNSSFAHHSSTTQSGAKPVTHRDLAPPTSVKHRSKAESRDAA